MRTLRGVFVLLMITSIACARGDWKDSPLHQWFEGLASRKGLCCSYADGETITDAQWDTKDGHYRVFLDHQWIVVPDDAVVKDANRYGHAVVWPLRTWTMDARTGTVVGERIKIRCFMPSAMS